jgi:hypothetical protein
MLIRENCIWLPNDVIANGVACHATMKLLQFYINIYCCDVTEDEAPDHAKRGRGSLLRFNRATGHRHHADPDPV